MTRLADICRGLGALTVLALLLVGFPLFMYATGGLPIPDRLPGWEEVYITLMQPDSDYSLFTGVLRLIGWGAWLLFIGIIGTETISFISGSDAPRLPTTVRPAQHLARDLITMTALIFTTSATITHTVEPHVAHATTAATEQYATPTPSTSNLHAQAVPAEASAAKEQDERPGWRTRTVKRADTLWDIARRHYGTGRLYPKIFKASRTIDQPEGLPPLTQPDRIYPGQKIRIPLDAPEQTPAQTPDQRPEPPAGTAGSPDQNPAPGLGTTKAHPAPQPDAHHPTSTPSVTGMPAVPPASAPTGAQAPDTKPQHQSSDTPSAITLVSDSRISIGLAAALSLALALTRLHRRRRRPLGTQPRLTTPTADPATPAAVARASKAHLDTYIERGEPIPTDSQLSSDNFLPPVFDHITVGTLRGEAVTLPLPGLSIAFDGDGAPDTIRAVATDLLANARHDRVELLITEHDARHLYPKTDITQIAADIPGLTITPTFGDALTHVENTMINRGRILLNTECRDIPSLREDDPAERMPHMIIVGGVPEEMSLRLHGVLSLGRQYHLGAILSGTWPQGTTVHLTSDGTITHAHGPHADHLTGAELFHLTTDDAADMLHTLHTATGKHDPEPAPPQPTDPSPPPPELPPAPTSGEEQQAVVHLELLGPVRLRTSDHPIHTGLREIAVSMLAYLALHPGGVTRDQANAALWADDPPEKARSNFHTAVSNIRKVLRDATGLHQPMFILHTAGRYRLDPHLIDVDTWRLSALHEQVHQAEDDSQRIDALQRFTDLYTDDFATNLGGEWAQAHREFLRRTAVDEMTHLAQLTADRHPEQALDTLEKAFRHDPYSEPLCHSIMQLQDRLHRPDAARRTYQLLSNRLSDLDLDPEEENKQLLTDIWQRNRRPQVL